MTRYDELKLELQANPRTWLVTGVAGFIGSNLLEQLLRLGQRVVGLDNFATGHRKNLEDVRAAVEGAQWANFRFMEGDIRRIEDCRAACQDVEHVLHQGALGSVPRSLEDPLTSHAANVDGFLNLLVAAKEADLRCIVYASSSSVYGDHPALPKVESNIGQPLSPYAATKLMNEIYAGVFSRSYGLQLTGLRYFNVFGPRQDPNGAYAAVIPRWYAALLAGQPVAINGDGSTSRDFCYIENVVQANLLAAVDQSEPARSRVYNVACGQRTTLLELLGAIRESLVDAGMAVRDVAPIFRAERVGDVRHSLADTRAARTELGYVPTHDLRAGLRTTRLWYIRQSSNANANSHAST